MVTSHLGFDSGHEERETPASVKSPEEAKDQDRQEAFDQLPAVLFPKAYPAMCDPARKREIGIVLPNNQGQHRTLHIQRDVLPHALCCFLWPLSVALARIFRMDSISTPRSQPLRGYLAHKKLPPPRTLQWAYTLGPTVVLGGGQVSYGRGTPVTHDPAP